MHYPTNIPTISVCYRLLVVSVAMTSTLDCSMIVLFSLGELVTRCDSWQTWSLGTAFATFESQDPGQIFSLTLTLPGRRLCRSGPRHHEFHQARCFYHL